MSRFDQLDSAGRSELMAKVRKKDTKPELIVRRVAHAMGYRFRLHRRDLPGTPHLVVPGRQKAVFVHGCFWHRHDCVSCRKRPSKNRDYWLPKLQRNAECDKASRCRLECMGWDVLVFWECQVGDQMFVREWLRRFLEEC